MSAHDVLRREARLIILKFLAAEPNRSLTSTSLTIQMNETFLMGRERDWVEQEMDYLASMGAIDLKSAGTVKVGRLLRHGARHLALMISIPGILIPTEPLVLPEANGG